MLQNIGFSAIPRSHSESGYTENGKEINEIIREILKALLGLMVFQMTLFIEGFLLQMCLGLPVIGKLLTGLVSAAEWTVLGTATAIAVWIPILAVHAMHGKKLSFILTGLVIGIYLGWDTYIAVRTGRPLYYIITMGSGAVFAVMMGLIMGGQEHD